MSSGLLYLAIVGVWALVLVPMWVRSSDAGEERAVSGEGVAGWLSVFRRLARVDAVAEEGSAGDLDDDVDERSPAPPDSDAAAGYAVRFTRSPEEEAVLDAHPPRRRVSRARIIARRRRRLTGISLLFTTAVVLAVSGVADWWVVPVPGLLLVTYLACLRGASEYDRELRARRLARAAAERRREEMAKVVPGPGLARSADEPPQEPLFDQYARPARAVGD